MGDIRPICRVGLVVPRFKHSAVARNLVKRRLRELARLLLLPTQIPIDVVLRIRPQAYDASFEALESEIRATVIQLRRLFGENAGAAFQGNAPEATP